MTPPVDSSSIFLDEDVGSALALMLRAAGDFDVLTTAEAHRASQGFSDETQLEFATQQNRAIFSFNQSDYERIAREWAFNGKHHAGIVVARQRPELRDVVLGFLELLLLYPNGVPPDLCMHLPRSRQF